MCVGYAVFEAVASIYDAYDLAKTAASFLAGRASSTELAATAAGAAAGLVGFGGGYGRAGREVASRLINDVPTHPENWRVVGSFTEAATNRKARGGVSIQTVFENEAGDQVVRRTVRDRSGRVIDDHYRPVFKPRAEDLPKENP